MKKWPEMGVLRAAHNCATFQCECPQALRLNKILGVITLKMVAGMCVRKDPFFMLPHHSTRSPFQHFLVPQGSNFNKKSQNLPIFCSKCLILTNFQVLMTNPYSLKRVKKSHSRSLNFGQKSVLKATFCQKISSTSPQICSRSILQSRVSGVKKWLEMGVLRAAHNCATFQCECPQALRLNKILGGGGYNLGKGYRDVCQERPLFYAFSIVPQDPFSVFFTSTSPPF